MNLKPISQAKDAEMRHAIYAMQRAAQMACKVAIQTNTKLVVMRDGQLLEISAQELLNAQKKSASL